MKMLTRLTAGTLLAMAAGQAMAATDSVDVKVTGEIVPPACVPAVTDGAVFDYGSIKAASLAKDDYTVLGTKFLTLTVTCDSPMKVAFSAVDARAGTAVPPVGKALLINSFPVTADDPGIMGLGTTADGKNIGGYKALFNVTTTTLVDGQRNIARAIESKDGGSTWSVPAANCQGCGWLNPQAANTLTSIAKTGTTEPRAFTMLSTTFQVQAAINKGSELDLTKTVNIDGLMSIQMTYL